MRTFIAWTQALTFMYAANLNIMLDPASTKALPQCHLDFHRQLCDFFGLSLDIHIFSADLQKWLQTLSLELQHQQDPPSGASCKDYNMSFQGGSTVQHLQEIPSSQCCNAMQCLYDYMIYHLV